MNGYNFTERVRKCLAYAREEAGRLHHEYVGTEHILLGIVREGEGVASTVIESLNVKLETVREAVERTVKTGKAAEATGPDLPYTSRAKSALELAMSEARELGHSYVGTEHLLLGLLREKKGIAGQVLVSLGVTLERARAEVNNILGVGPASREKGERSTGDLMFGFSRATPATGSVRILLAISAIPAWVIGVLLIFNAKEFEAPMGIVVDEKTATIAQAQGAILVGLGFINWLSRGVTDREALWAVLYGNFVVQIMSFCVVLSALVHGVIPTSGIGALALHVLLGSAFAWQALQLRRAR